MSDPCHRAGGNARESYFLLVRPGGGGGGAPLFADHVEKVCVGGLEKGKGGEEVFRLAWTRWKKGREKSADVIVATRSGGIMKAEWGRAFGKTPRFFEKKEGAEKRRCGIEKASKRPPA